MALDLVPVWAGLLALAVLMYVLLDGFDLGVGIIFLQRTDDRERDLMVSSVAPVWDFNETWLVFGGTALMGVFPVAFAVIIPAVYFPILLMLLGLLFRGVAFEFREVVGARKQLWNRAFCGGSLLATFAQGIVLGSFIHGFPVKDGQFVGTSWDWFAPFPLMTGVGLVFGYTLQGSTWLIMKTEGELQRWARMIARRTLAGVVLFIVAVSIWTPSVDPRIAARWFSLPNLIFFSPVPILTALLAWQLLRSLQRDHEVVPFLCSIGLFLLAFSGLIISLWPYVAPPTLTLRAAAASPLSHEFLMIGTAFILPVLLMYVFWSYWVFRGKVRHDTGYH
ncbi:MULTISPECIES: cytochrome d ubiquinol oxidase subunit II [Paraburkholderia]|uniref:cytochrome d ubiquinol oxidase subunit II n=1 Tax=Paraburkholderia TaxID=1822464 RepID=UPI0022533335|nr:MULTISPECIES: cytochrome d ubiquinol oxidase subunit II [Paraburkholderia]MCX4166036.1 cytochrome d ubiquinol oxidase subunit II [Paraburkholderia megapolitana]MDN7161526.1 cytochrome d ubiquinol oxidase subunit II [Paraburkholderia sp. CHISQ3]MDQ6498574.1 cytochrome d ubiquinol oxidase subunit II [Paraburkholderia megapolitana]